MSLLDLIGMGQKLLGKGADTETEAHKPLLLGKCA